MNAEQLISTRSLHPEQAASEFMGALRVLDTSYRVNFSMRGLILREMEDRELWRVLGYGSMNQCIREALPWSERDSYYALGAAKELKDIPVETLAEMPRVNIEKLRIMSTQVRQQPDVLEAAQKCSEEQFVDYVQSNYPDQAMEHRKRMPKVAESTYSVLEEAIDKAYRVEGCKGREEALLAISTHYLNSVLEGELAA